MGPHATGAASLSPTNPIEGVAIDQDRSRPVCWHPPRCGRAANLSLFPKSDGGRIGSNLDADFLSPVTPRRNGRLRPCSADSPQQHAQVAMILEAAAWFRPR